MTQRRGLIVLAAALMATGCLALDDTASPTPDGTPSPIPALSAPPRDPTELVVGLPADPLSFLPPTADEPGTVLGDLLHDPLYRLDTTLTARPALATALPAVSTDGLIWRVTLRTGATFHDGRPVRASDAAFSLALASSPSCPFGRELCDAVAQRMASAEAEGPQVLVVTLREPWSPFLAVVMGRLPVLSEASVGSATASLLDDAAGLDAGTLQELVARITEDTNAERCLVARPPTGCRLGDHADELSEVLSRAGVAPPPGERFAAVDGTVDTEAHGEALLGSVAALATVLRADGTDQLAAAIPLLDPVRHPLGGGPFRLEAYRPGEAIELVRHGGHLPEPAGSEAIRLRIMRDPAAATAALRGGDVDWLLHVEPDQAAALAADAGLRVAAHPEPIVRSIVFNVRRGRVFEDPVTRRALALCVDRSALVAEATGGSAVPAVLEVAPASWALASTAAPSPADPAAASSELDDAGWSLGADGVYQRGGVRLSAEIHVRPTRLDLVAFARGAAEQLRSCGIELLVQELDLTGELLLAQLQWPNEFEAILVARTLGVDPDADLAAFEGSHVTTADNPGDANPGGYASAEVDRLLAAARTTTDPVERAGLYGQVADLLAVDPPSLPLWYDIGHAAISSRIAKRDGDPDPAQPRYWWDAWTWRIATP